MIHRQFTLSCKWISIFSTKWQREKKAIKFDIITISPISLTLSTIQASKSSIGSQTVRDQRNKLQRNTYPSGSIFPLLQPRHVINKSSRPFIIFCNKENNKLFFNYESHEHKVKRPVAQHFIDEPILPWPMSTVQPEIRPTAYNDRTACSAA